MFVVNKERNVISVARITCIYVVVQTLISYITICSSHKRAPNQCISTRNIHLLPTVLVASQKLHVGHVWKVRSPFSGARHSSTFDCCFCTLVDVSS